MEIELTATNSRSPANPNLRSDAKYDVAANGLTKLGRFICSYKMVGDT